MGKIQYDFSVENKRDGRKRIVDNSNTVGDSDDRHNVEIVHIFFTIVFDGCIISFSGANNPSAFIQKTAVTSAIRSPYFSAAFFVMANMFALFFCFFLCDGRSICFF